MLLYVVLHFQAANLRSGFPSSSFPMLSPGLSTTSRTRVGLYFNIGVSILPWPRRSAGVSERGEDIEGMEEGIGWGLVTLLDGQILQDEAISGTEDASST